MSYAIPGLVLRRAAVQSHRMEGRDALRARFADARALGKRALHGLFAPARLAVREPERIGTGVSLLALLAGTVGFMEAVGQRINAETQYLAAAFVSHASPQGGEMAAGAQHVDSLAFATPAGLGVLGLFGLGQGLRTMRRRRTTTEDGMPLPQDLGGLGYVVEEVAPPTNLPEINRENGSRYYASTHTDRDLVGLVLPETAWTQPSHPPTVAA